MNVPQTVDNPIKYLKERGVTATQMAYEWGYASSNSIGPLENFEQVPTHGRAEKMRITFGWKSAGQVIDYYAPRVRAREESKVTA